MPPALCRLGLVLALLCVSQRAPAASDLSCEAAGGEAELAWHLPPGLLAAVGRIEAGRADPEAGRVVAWPWTVNGAGQGHYYTAKADAVAAVRALQMGGLQSIDVGCFQINLMFHPGAFASLDDAFDTRTNADFAARFLSELHDRAGSWETAVAWYHSATPGQGEPYRDRVLADWNGGGVRILPVAALLSLPGGERRHPGHDPMALGGMPAPYTSFAGVHGLGSAVGVGSGGSARAAGAGHAGGVPPGHRPWTAGRA